MKICKVEGCEKKSRAKGYCNKHYQQMKKYGKTLNRTTHDPNEIILKEDYAEIILYNVKSKEVARALIDLDDVERIKGYKWYLGHGYVSGVIKKRCIFLHRFLLNPPKENEIDHINHIPTDNRKSNLRVCTSSQNKMNQKSKGYYWKKEDKKWYVRIAVDRKTISLGLFNTEAEAKEVRKQAEIKYFKEFRYKE